MRKKTKVQLQWFMLLCVRVGCNIKNRHEWSETMNKTGEQGKTKPDTDCRQACNKITQETGEQGKTSPTPFVHAGAFEWTGKMIQAWNKREHMQLGLEVLESSNCDCSYCYTWVGCNTKTFFLFLGNPKKKPKKKGVELWRIDHLSS